MKTKFYYSACIVAVLCISHVAFSTALDDYVAMPDSNFSWSQYGPSVYDGSPFSGYTGTEAYVLEVTSQAWRQPSEVDTTVWTHWVTIIVPRDVWLLGPVKDTALIFINEGDIVRIDTRSGDYSDRVRKA